MKFQEAKLSAISSLKASHAWCYHPLIAHFDMAVLLCNNSPQLCNNKPHLLDFKLYLHDFYKTMQYGL